MAKDYFGHNLLKAKLGYICDLICHQHSPRRKWMFAGLYKTWWHICCTGPIWDVLLLKWSFQPMIAPRRWLPGVSWAYKDLQNRCQVPKVLLQPAQSSNLQSSFLGWKCISWERHLTGKPLWVVRAPTIWSIQSTSLKCLKPVWQSSLQWYPNQAKRL